MPIYISSKGEQIETSTMNEKYLERALAKAQVENNQANVDALETEIASRASN